MHFYCRQIYLSDICWNLLPRNTGPPKAEIKLSGCWNGASCNSASLSAATKSEVPTNKEAEEKKKKKKAKCLDLLPI